MIQKYDVVRLRSRLGLSQEKFAEKLGVSQTTAEGAGFFVSLTKVNSTMEVDHVRKSYNSPSSTWEDGRSN